MGKYFRGGRLYSADTFRISGSRTLAAATASDIWAGTAATRPQPSSSGEQLHVISSSVEDDDARQQSGTITISGTMDPAVADVWTVTAGGAVDAGDVANIVFDAVNYSVMITAAMTTTADVAVALDGALTNGTTDTYFYSVGVGGADAGDNLRLSIDGNDYDVTLVGGETAADVCAAMETAASADANYDVTQQPPTTGTTLVVAKKVAGVNAGSVACSWTVDTGSDATATESHPVVGTAAISGYTSAPSGSDVVITQDTAGTAGVVVVSSSYATDPGVDSTLTTVHTATGADADVLAVSDGTTTFSHTVSTAVLADEVATLAALIAANAAYEASSVDGVITVVAAVDGTAFTFSDASVDNQTADLGVVVDNTAVLGNGGGSGVRTLRIDYLDASGIRQAETVSVNGTTAVATTATDVTSILGVTALTVGSGGGAAGTISVKDVAESVVYEVIPASSNQSSSADYQIPANLSGYVTALHLSAGATACTVTLKSDCNPATGTVVSGASFVWHQAIVGTDPESISPVVPLGPFAPGSRVWASGLHTAGTAVAVSVEGYLAPQGE